MNGDGYADLVVGAPQALRNWGKVYPYLGSASGIATTPAVTITGGGAANLSKWVAAQPGEPPTSSSPPPAAATFRRGAADQAAPGAPPTARPASAVSFATFPIAADTSTASSSPSGAGRSIAVRVSIGV